ncbi:hypothetical protein GCK72_012639 [Caenorhabditis remanei]|uniref:Nuclear receptor domain-containing protein n=1 Tax=Caenorhabditis remanei TaxID=31234 RepID=A0A6A5GNS7_CAERE|nr:hypothetical protein GCK72_012639 [Caenorhabditis remanei]KAF1756186.1 hypothetical protein GCK72_012639 [Caenorhabditis remanei]
MASGQNVNRTVENNVITLNVCGVEKATQHYGALSCVGCKGFFRRALLKADQLECAANGECTVSVLQKIQCRSCRFNKCLREGMNPAFVRPNRDAPSKPRKPATTVASCDLTDRGRTTKTREEWMKKMTVEMRTILMTLLNIETKVMKGDTQQEASKLYPLKGIDKLRDIVETPISLKGKRTEMRYEAYRMAGKDELCAIAYRRLIAAIDWVESLSPLLGHLTVDDKELANAMSENLQFAQTFLNQGEIPLLTDLFGCFTVEPFFKEVDELAALSLEKALTEKKEISTQTDRVPPPRALLKRQATIDEESEEPARQNFRLLQPPNNFYITEMLDDLRAPSSSISLSSPDEYHPTSTAPMNNHAENHLMGLNYDASTIQNGVSSNGVAHPPTVPTVPPVAARPVYDQQPSCSNQNPSTFYNFPPPPGYPPLNAGYTPNINYPQLYQQPQYYNFPAQNVDQTYPYSQDIPPPQPYFYNQNPQNYPHHHNNFQNQYAS